MNREEKAMKKEQERTYLLYVPLFFVYACIYAQYFLQVASAYANARPSENAKHRQTGCCWLVVTGKRSNNQKNFRNIKLIYNLIIKRHTHGFKEIRLIESLLYHIRFVEPRH